MNWLLKLAFDVVEADDKLSIEVTWDEKDPELSTWTSWDNELRSDFLIALLEVFTNELALNNQVIEELPEETSCCGIR